MFKHENIISQDQIFNQKTTHLWFDNNLQNFQQTVLLL